MTERQSKEQKGVTPNQQDLVHNAAAVLGGENDYGMTPMELELAGVPTRVVAAATKEASH